MLFNGAFIMYMLALFLVFTRFSICHDRLKVLYIIKVKVMVTLFVPEGRFGCRYKERIGFLHTQPNMLIFLHSKAHLAHICTVPIFLLPFVFLSVVSVV